MRFRMDFGHCVVLTCGKGCTDPYLARWTRWQRECLKNGKLGKEKKETLEKLGFVWTQREPPSKVNSLSSCSSLLPRLTNAPMIFKPHVPSS
jgi:hypothetical protein